MSCASFPRSRSGCSSGRPYPGLREGTHRRPLSAGLAPSSVLEEAIVRRRELERLRTEFWDDTVKYYKSVGSRADRINAWDERTSEEASSEAATRNKLREMRRRSLPARREKLRHLLETEAKAFALEKENVRATGRLDLAELRNARDALRKKRLQELEAEAEDKMLQHWKLNNPQFRELQLKKHRDMVVRAWELQKEEKELMREAERKAEMSLMQQTVEENIRRDLEQKRKEELNARKVEEWKQTVARQIEELKKTRQTENLLKEEIRMEQELLAEAQRIEKLRERLEKRRKGIELGQYLQRQHSLKLRMKAAEIQQEIEDDKRVLEELQRSLEAQTEAEQTKRKNQRNELQWLNRVLQEQKEVERARERRMGMLFNEDAEDFWERQQKLWDDEKKARQKLMDDVISGWKVQLNERVQEAERQAIEAEEERRKLEKEIELANQEMKEAEERQRQSKAIIRKDIEDQLDQPKRKPHMSTNGDDQSEINKLATRLAHFDAIKSEPALMDFRRRKAKWY